MIDAMEAVGCKLSELVNLFDLFSQCFLNGLPSEFAANAEQYHPRMCSSLDGIRDFAQAILKETDTAIETAMKNPRQ